MSNTESKAHNSANPKSNLQRFENKLPESGIEGTYRVQVLADSSGVWAGNGLSFTTIEHAENYARDLFQRWTAVREWRIIKMNDTETNAFEEVSRGN